MNKPKDDTRGEWKFQCEMCGDEIDSDYCYCKECGDHSGEWVLINEDGEVIEV